MSDKRVQNSLKKFHNNYNAANEGNEMCAVCLSNINENEGYKLECGHIFHTDCIVKWFRNSNGNCPCCCIIKT